MLNKKICRLCQKYARESICQRALDVSQKERLDANLHVVLNGFESMWKNESLVWCPSMVATQIAARAIDDGKTMLASTDGEPPEGCHYLLEQLVVNQIP